MAAKIYLNVVEDVESRDSVLHFDKMPAFRGDDDENLACGRCKIVIGRNVSTRTVHQQFATTGRLIIECECRAMNVVPSQRPS